VQVERRHRVPGALDLTDEPVDLGPMQQQLARARGVGVHVGRRRGERCDVRADQQDLAVLDDDVGFLELRPTRADRLHLPASEREAGLEAFLDKIVVKRLAVFDDTHDGMRIFRRAAAFGGGHHAGKARA